MTEEDLREMDDQRKSEEMDAVQQCAAEEAGLVPPSELWWDQHSVQCGNCSVEILTRNGSIPNNNGLSDNGGSEDELLCGRCAGAQMYAYLDQLAGLAEKRQNTNLPVIYRDSENDRAK